LAQALNKVEDVVHLEDEQEYQQVTVALHGRGLRLRRVVKGEHIKTKRQFRVRAGQFLYSRIDARNGAFGLVPEELDGAIVSNDFPAFDIVSEVAHPRYIGYLSRSKWFVAQCKDPSRGATNRRRMAEAQLLALDVPLPPPHEQERVVGIIDAVAARLDEARTIRASADREYENLLRAFAHEIAKGAPRRPMEEVAPVTRRSVKIDESVTYPEVGVRSFGRGLFVKPELNGADLTWQRLYQMQSGDLLFSNIKAWEGAVAVITDEFDGFVGSHRYITCRADPHLATPEFLCHWLLTEEGLRHLGRSSPGATDRNRTLGLKKLQAIPVPVPPLEAQQRLTRIARHVASARQAQSAIAEELESMLPALLDRAFKGEQ
jgi:type I restriction enzyme S subunit